MSIAILRRMDHVRLGRQVRALRRRRGWRQADLAIRAGMSRPTVSRIELGHVCEVTVRAVEAVAAALSARFDANLNWNGEGLDRLLDADHAAIVESVARTLRSLGWEVVIEASFNIRGERGSVDILAFHSPTGMVLVVEVKSVVPDVQATLFVLDRNARLGAEIARQNGWVARGVGRLLVVRGSRTARRRIEAHATVFGAVLPARNLDVRRWLRAPDASRPFAGLWFLTDDRHPSTRHRVAAGREPRPDRPRRRTEHVRDR